MGRMLFVKVRPAKLSKPPELRRGRKYAVDHEDEGVESRRQLRHLLHLDAVHMCAAKQNASENRSSSPSRFAQIRESLF